VVQQKATAMITPISELNFSLGFTAHLFEPASVAFRPKHPPIKQLYILAFK
jgi:hypothetical protein